MKPEYFASPQAWRGWLEQHHADSAEIVVGFHHKASGRCGLTYGEALDEALCFGWIDGIRRSGGEGRYTIRFTPRRPGSIWSLVNVRHFERLAGLGRIRPAGQAAYDRRDPKKTGIYSFENRPKVLPPELVRIFRANRKAWTFWSGQPPGYQRLTVWWIMSAKQDETRRRRLATLIAKSAAGTRVG